MHYLPHRGVVREDHDTTKLRIIFDASAKIRNELSLNDILYSGPCLLPSSISDRENWIGRRYQASLFAGRNSGRT